mgnify:CR=1 FL=1
MLILVDSFNDPYAVHHLDERVVVNVLFEQDRRIRFCRISPFQLGQLAAERLVVVTVARIRIDTEQALVTIADFDLVGTDNDFELVCLVLGLGGLG